MGTPLSGSLPASGEREAECAKWLYRDADKRSQASVGLQRILSCTQRNRLSRNRLAGRVSLGLNGAWLWRITSRKKPRESHCFI
jgi:hypothetical protein